MSESAYANGCNLRTRLGQRQAFCQPVVSGDR